ncbi:MAG: ParB/RepB/Spo0J family partition protein [Magnetococcus sp. WYHC-3]
MNMKRASLGRGLGSLLGQEATNDGPRKSIRWLALDQIQPNPRQPRTRFAPEEMEELTRSVQEHGVLQPLLVRRVNLAGLGETERFELIAGERRLRAARAAGLDRVPALLEELDDATSLEVAILENVQREDLNPIDSARGYQQLVSEFGYSHQDIARRVGRNRITITNALRLLQLPPQVLTALEEGRLTQGHGKALLGLEGHAEALTQLACQAIDEQYSVRQLEEAVRAAQKMPHPRRSSVANTQQSRKDPALQAMESNLASVLQAKVSITQRGGRGRVVVDYATLAELDQLVERLLQVGHTAAEGGSAADPWRKSAPESVS